MVFLLILFNFAGWSSYKNPNYAYPHKGKISIDATLLGRCFALEAIEANHAVPANIRKSSSKCRERFDSDEFVRYLAAYPNHCDFPTGKENQLRTWILEQPDNSIDPVTIFRESLKINNGDIWSALLTVHQLVRNEARWYNRRYYYYESTPEDEKKFFDKMIDIRGDLAELGRPNSGDHEGTWYRIWGIMMYRMTLGPEEIKTIDTSYIVQCQNIPRVTLQRHLGDLKSNAVAIAAEGAKLLGATDGEKDWRKVEINLRGVATASSFLKAVTYTRETREDPDLPDLCKNRKYLVDSTSRPH